MDLKARYTLPLALVVVVGLAGLLGAAEPRITMGNVINITVLGYPELSKSVVVRQDGTVDYPMLYNIPVEGMTVTELRELLLPILGRFVERPYLFVNISEFLQLQVTVQGQVRNPGVHVVRGPLDIQGLLAAVGGPTSEADLAKISIIRGSGDKASSLVVDLFALLRGERSEPVMVQNGDIVFIPTLTPASMVRVLGAVRSPGAYLAAANENVADMVFRAGGPAPQGDLRRVTWVTHDPDGHARVITLNIKREVLQGRSEWLPLVKAGDLIIIREIPDWMDYHTLAQMIRDLSIIASSYLIFRKL